MELPIWKLQRYRILVLCGLGNIIGTHSEKLIFQSPRFKSHDCNRKMTENDKRLYDSLFFIGGNSRYDQTKQLVNAN